MNGLDSSLEALAFIPVNLGPLFSAVTATNLWALLAVVTAAFSFWRLRTTSVKTTTTISHIILSPPPTTITKTTPLVVVNNEESKNDEEEEEAVLTRGNSKKFFTVYYHEMINDENIKEDENNDDYDGDDDEVEGGDEESEGMKGDDMVIRGWGSTELTVEIRGGEFGFYSYQNRKVIDGSVVRLWAENGECGSPSPRSCRIKRCSSFVRC